jgi:glucose-1-phosphate thymidylyltransferase
MKGILLAAGRGTRLYPMTRPVCKPLLPIYDKPMLYYPLAVLLQAGIREILVIVPPGEEETFWRLLGDGSQWGVSISLVPQPVPRGIADALLVGEDFLCDDSLCLILGDNLFFSPTLPEKLQEARRSDTGATIFGRWVIDPRAFGVVEFDKEGRAVSIEEKPAHPKSHYVVPGLYFYKNAAEAVELVRTLSPSARGELEITDLNQCYLHRGDLSVIPLDTDVTWLDAGTADSLLEAAKTVRRIQHRTGRLVACLEEDAVSAGLIPASQARTIGQSMATTDYGQYLLKRFS